MKKMDATRGRGGRIAIAWRVFAVAMVVGMTAPATGGIVVPTPAEAQLSDLRQVKRVWIFNVCTQKPCMGGYCCGWAGF